MGVLEEVNALRACMVTDLPTFDVSQVDKLEDYAHALSYINNRYQAAIKDPDDLDELTAEAAKLRERYLAEARAFTHHGIIREGELNNLKGANGRKNTATDLGILVGILETAWPKMQGKTPTTIEDLQHASRVSTRMLRIIGAKEQGPSLVAEVTDHRVRAYTKLLNVYESIQRAVAFLRGDRYDTDTIVPSLFKGRPASRGSEETTDATPATASATPSADALGKTPPAFAPDAFGPSGPFMPVK